MIKFKAIIAMDKNNIIGNNGNLPWKGDPNTKWDMDNFKEVTSNKIVIMGYNTYKSFKRPLKNRLNLVLARPYENEKFYSLKEDKAIYTDLSLHSNFSNEESVEKALGKVGLEKYQKLSFPYTNENNSFTDINKVNMTNNKLDTLFSFITIDSFDYRFIYIPKALLNDKERRINEFDHLARNTLAIRDICLSNYKNSGCNNDSITKIKNFNPNEIFIIGGLRTYEDYIDLIDEFIVTQFDKEYKGELKFNKELLSKFNKQETIKEVPGSGKIIRYYKE